MQGAGPQAILSIVEDFRQRRRWPHPAVDATGDFFSSLLDPRQVGRALQVENFKA